MVRGEGQAGILAVVLSPNFLPHTTDKHLVSPCRPSSCLHESKEPGGGVERATVRRDVQDDGR